MCVCVCVYACANEKYISMCLSDISRAPSLRLPLF